MAANREMNADGVAGSSRIEIDPEASDNTKLGIHWDWKAGTSGSREGATYGGDENKGVDYPRATSASGVSKEKNAGNKEYRGDSNDDLVGGAKSVPEGTNASRENETYGGDTNKRGRIAGKGAGSNGAINTADVLINGNKTFDRAFVLEGTGDEKNQYKRTGTPRGYGKAKSPREGL